MICPICKSNIRDDAVFCPVCGKPVPQKAPDVHNIETVELPTRTDGRTPSAADLQESQVPVQEQPEMNDLYNTPEKELHPTPQSKMSEQPAEHTGKESSAQREHYRQGNAVPGQQGRSFQQYRNIPPQGHAPRGAGSRPNNQRNRQMMPVSEKEAFHLKDNLSKKAMVAFICSIFGIGAIAMNLPFAVVGLVFSIIVRNGYRDRGWQKDSDLKLANAAFVCSIIGIVLGVIGLIVLMVTGAGIVAALTSLASLSSGGSYYGF